MRDELVREAIHHLVEEVIFVNDADRDIVFVTPSVTKVLGYEPDAFLALKTWELLHPDDLEEAGRLAGELRETAGATYRSTLRVRHADGRWIWCEIVGRNLLHAVGGIVTTVRDVSERRALEDRLREQSRVDELTGLANRRGFLAEMDARVVRDPGLGLLMVDLSGVRSVNAGHGHAIGDALLRECAARVSTALGPGEVAGRLAGDEFGVLCRRVEDLVALERVAARVLDVIAGPWPALGAEFRMSAVVGAALAEPGHDGAALLRRADAALERARENGPGSVVLSDADGVSH